MKRDELFRDFTAQFRRRKFVGGLLVAFIDLFDALEADAVKAPSFNAFLKHFPRMTTTTAGARANTLILQTGDDTKSLRPFYNAAETVFRAEHKRFDYPSCAPHATQAWGDYIPWLDALLVMGTNERARLRHDTLQFVLDELPSHAFDPASVEIDPPLFKMILEKFDMEAKKGEKTGAAFQGIVFGFIRADNPHLQVEIDKVRTGSKRLQRVGDVDAWEGERLAITAEAKQYVIEDKNVSDLKAFTTEATRRGAIAIVAALDFAEGVRDVLLEQGAEPVSQGDMTRIAALWDPVKQRTAVSSFVFYAKHIEKNASLADRLKQFLKDCENEWRAPGAAPE